MDGIGKKRGKKGETEGVGAEGRNLKCHFRQVGETENAADSF